MNKTAFYLKFLVFSFIILNCLTTNSGEYHNKKANYSIHVPAKWKIKKRYVLKTEVVQIINPQDKTNYVIVTDDKKGNDSIEEYQEKSIRKLKIIANKLNLNLEIRNEEKYEIRDIPYIKIEYNGIDKDGDKRNNIAYTIKYKNIFYIITFSAKADKYDDYKNIFEEIIKSFKIN